jgi:ATP-dependent Lhr-like helicase
VSALPTPDILLVETLDSREGSRLFVYPFLGRVAHLGMASLVAWRAARGEAGAFTTSANDYGFEILSATPRDFAGQLADLLDGSCSRNELARQALASSNAGELAKRRFRDIARVAGLVLANHPGGHKGGRQLQASSDLYYDVFQKFDSDNALLRQAEREVLEAELDIDLLIEGFERLRRRALVHKPLARCSPLAFPLMVESLRERMSTEELTARVERMIRQLERAGTRV